MSRDKNIAFEIRLIKNKCQLFNEKNHKQKSRNTKPRKVLIKSLSTKVHTMRQYTEVTTESSRADRTIKYINANNFHCLRPEIQAWCTDSTYTTVYGTNMSRWPKPQFLGEQGVGFEILVKCLFKKETLNISLKCLSLYIHTASVKVWYGFGINRLWQLLSNSFVLKVHKNN